MATKVFIGNLPARINEQGLKKVFMQIGEVQKVQIARDPRTRRSRGYGFVEMSLDLDAYRAEHILNGTTHGGKRLQVIEIKEH